MMKETVIFLVRHGETVDNVAQIMQGQTQGELTEHGREQAAEVRELMRDRHIDAVVSSDLKRSVDTARIIAEPHGLAVVETPLLRERDWGDFTGRYIPDLQGEVWPENVESLDCLLERAQRFLDYMSRNYANQTVVAVGHGIVNKAIQAVFHHKPINQIPRMGNAEVRELHLAMSAEVSATPVATAAVTAAAMETTPVATAATVRTTTDARTATMGTTADTAAMTATADTGATAD